MSNSFLIPFNNNPVSTTVKTGAYTIPSGQYARIIVTDLSDAFEIDSVVAAEATIYKSTFNSQTTGTKFTNNSPYVLKGSISLDSASSVSSVFGFGDSAQASALYTVDSTTRSVNDISISPGSYIYTTTGSGGAITNSYSLVANSPPTPIVLWVKTAAVLDGTRYIVELYNNIS